LLPAGGINAWQLEASSEGAWGNNLAVTIRRATRGVARTIGSVDVPPLRTRSTVGSFTGFEAGSLVRLQQGTVTGYAVVAAMDPYRTRLEWHEALPDAFDLAQPINLETVEFSLLVYEAGQVSERYPFLSVVPGHSRYAPDVLRAQSHLVRLCVAPGGEGCPDVEAEQPQVPYAEWQPLPIELRGLSGGREGLQSATLDDLLRGMEALEGVSDVAILACPDLMARPVQPPRSRKAVRPPVESCLVGVVPQAGGIAGTVVDGLSGEPLTAALVTLAGVGAIATAADGTFAFGVDQVPVGNAELVLSRQRYSERTVAVAVKANQVQAVTDRDGEGNPLGAVQLMPLEQPPAWSAEQILDAQARLIGQCERLRDRVAILDMPAVTDEGAPFGLDEIQTWRARFDSAFAAFYVPWLRVKATTGVRAVPPSGYVAGVYARTDLRDGVHRAPANEAFAGVEDVTLALDDAQHGLLNGQGINVIRPFAGRGIRVYGARSASSDSQWRFINVRRLVSMIEKALIRDTQWAVFESHTAELRRGLSLTVYAFLEALWRRGALAGDTPEGSFALRCDEVNNPPDGIAAGRLVCDIAVAPAVPFEFVVFRLGRSLETVEISER
jgi:hypothetical protein